MTADTLKENRVIFSRGPNRPDQRESTDSRTAAARSQEQPLVTINDPKKIQRVDSVTIAMRRPLDKKGKSPARSTTKSPL